MDHGFYEGLNLCVSGGGGYADLEIQWMAPWGQTVKKTWHLVLSHSFEPVHPFALCFYIL